MKLLSIATAISLASCSAAGAQEPPRAPMNRGDAHFVIGWQNLHEEQPTQQNYSNDWLNGIFYGAAGAGWYWMDHLKTQVDFGAGTQGHQYRYEPIVVNG